MVHVNGLQRYAVPGSGAIVYEIRWYRGFFALYIYVKGFLYEIRCEKNVNTVPYTSGETAALPPHEGVQGEDYEQRTGKNL